MFATIGERARHLHGFIAGYASFAKLPAPRKAAIAWAPFLEGLALHCRFRLVGLTSLRTDQALDFTRAPALERQHAETIKRHPFFRLDHF